VVMGILLLVQAHWGQEFLLEVATLLLDQVH